MFLLRVLRENLFQASSLLLNSFSLANNKINRQINRRKYLKFILWMYIWGVITMRFKESLGTLSLYAFLALRRQDGVENREVVAFVVRNLKGLEGNSHVNEKANV